jgi:hypothetical protein
MPDRLTNDKPGLCFVFAQKALLGCHENDAEDLTQEFFVNFLARRRVQEADPAAGKFRTFVLTHFSCMLKDHLKAKRAQKRGGTLQHVSAEELTDADSPVTLPDPSSFDVWWAIAIIREAMRLLELEETRRDGRIPFEELKGFLPVFQAGRDSSYETLKKRYGVTFGTLRLRVSDLRNRFKEVRNAVLADTVSSAADLESERQSLVGGILRSLG